MRIVTFALALVAAGAVSVPAQEEIPQFFAVEVPAGVTISPDGDLSDWNWFPEVAAITNQELASQHDHDVTYDPTDFDVRVMLAYSAETNQLYVGMEIFDDLLHRIPSADDKWTWGAGDDMEIYTDIDNSGGQYQWSADLPRETWAQTAQQWWYMIGPSDEPYGGVLNHAGTWMNEPPYHVQALAITPAVGGERMVWEVAMTTWDFLHGDGPGASTVHTLREGDIVGMSWVYADFDVDKAYEGYWKMHRPRGAHENADVLADVTLIKGAPDQTSVERSLWGRIKASFAE